MNKITVYGRLTKDIETRQLQSGKTMASVGIASNGKTKEETNFFDAKAFSGLADVMAKYLHKGDSLVAYGTMHQYTYNKQDGTTMKGWELLIDDIDFCGKSASGGNATPNATQQNGSMVEEPQEVQLPF